MEKNQGQLKCVGVCLEDKWVGWGRKKHWDPQQNEEQLNAQMDYFKMYSFKV